MESDLLKMESHQQKEHPSRKPSDRSHCERRRSDARQRVAAKWAERIDQKSQQRRSDNQDTQSKQRNRIEPEQTQEQMQRSSTKSFRSVCFFIQNLWKDALNQQPQQASNQSQLQQDRKGSVRDKDTRGSRRNPRASFPSVLSILQETALKQQVESFDVRTTSTEAYTRMTSQSEVSDQSSSLPSKDAQVEKSTSSSETPLPLLSVLPAHYDFSQAIIKMSQSRSRAFLLLDLAAIVKTHVYWRKLLQFTTIPLPPKLTKPAPFVQMVYNVQHNTNLQLLQLFQRLNVTCKVSTKYDLELLCNSKVFDSSMGQPKMNENAPAKASVSTTPISNTMIMDNASCPAKPNSFYRKLVLEHNITTLAVDGPDEVVRLHHALEKMARRRQQKCPPLSFILRLSGGAAQWPAKGLADSTVIDVHYSKQLLKQTKTIIDSLPDHELSGISLALPCWNGDDDTIHDPNTSSPDIDAFCGTISEVLHYMREDLLCPCQQLDLTTTAVTTLPPTLIEWFSQIQPKKTSSNSLLNSSAAYLLVKQVTLDVSYLLVARAGALCTRIIGVKEQENADNSTFGEKADSIGKTSEDEPTTSVVHYYIDDGCYGSLYSATKDVVHIPLPLRRRQEDGAIYEGGKTNPETDGATQSYAINKDAFITNATVWGPTCDGLDKVCQDIMLPKLARDDWLVFPNLGFCNVGTAFNGFSPPDMAYCVLGYLHQHE